MTRCGHDRGRPCPWPGCSAGVKGTRLVVCGPRGAVTYTRGFEQVGDELRVAWVKVEGAPARAEEVACQA